jgi:pimeloyl-ACP methyl ester carboxylesterase
MPTVRVGSHFVYYDNSGAGHPVLLIGGLGVSRFIWWKQLDTLSGRYRLINMDNRDAGDSALGTGPYTIGDLAEDTAGLIRSLKCERTYIVGWSMGGFIALELALQHPELVGKLVLVATSAGGSAHVPPSWQNGLMLLPQEMEGFEDGTRRLYSSLAAPGYMESNGDVLEKVLEFVRLRPMSWESYQRQVSAAMTWRGVGDRLGSLSLPTLVVHGLSDPLVPYANGQYLSDNIRNARLVAYSGVGHLPPIEASSQFNRDVMEFLG